MRKLGISWLDASARRMLRVEKPRRVGESREAYLARVLSGKRARGVGQLVALRQKQKAARLTQRRLPDLSRESAALREPAAMLARLLRTAPALSDQLSLLHEIFTAGGYETAEVLANQLEPAVRAAPRALRARAVPILTRVWMTAGQAARALHLWETAGTDIPLHHPLHQALRLGLGALDQARFNMGRTLYPYLAEAAVQAGRADEVLEQIAAAPWLILLNPELELILHNAQRRVDASSLVAFNRFLARHGLSALRIGRQPVSCNWLSSLSFARKAQARRGPLVSVIMSARNAQHTIGYAIDSILQQTYPAIELLVADDASSDETYAFVAQRYGRDARVRLYRSRDNQGTYNARNQLVAQARGELVTFQDADDVSLPARIATQVRALAQTGRVAAIAEWLRVRPDGSVTFFPNGRAARLSIVSLMVKRRVLLELGPYPSAKVGADLDLYRRVLRTYGAQGVARLPAPLLLGLWSDQSLTRSPQLQSLESGYRAPVRRRYSELVFRQDLFGSESLPGRVLEEELVRMDNYLAPSVLLAHRAG